MKDAVLERANAREVTPLHCPFIGFWITY